MDCYVQLDLRTPDGVEPGQLLPFVSLEAAYCDVYAAIPDAAAALLAGGLDPMACSYLMRGEDGRVLAEIRFSELVRAKPPPPVRRDAEDWLAVSARLKQRSDEAVLRFDRACSWMQRSLDRAARIDR